MMKITKKSCQMFWNFLICKFGENGLISEIYGTLLHFENHFLFVKFSDRKFLGNLVLFRIFGDFSMSMRRTTFSMPRNVIA